MNYIVPKEKSKWAMMYINYRRTPEIEIRQAMHNAEIEARMRSDFKPIKPPPGMYKFGGAGGVRVVNIGGSEIYRVENGKFVLQEVYTEGKEYKFILQMQPGDNMPMSETIGPILPPWVKFEDVRFIFGTKYSIDTNK